MGAARARDPKEKRGALAEHFERVLREHCPEALAAQAQEDAPSRPPPPQAGTAAVLAEAAEGRGGGGFTFGFG